uniref:Uncharacterized protein n=1 Tax=Arundo donax TaxID=35708 RepID=A0A0A8Y5U0_ARUDO
MSVKELKLPENAQKDHFFCRLIAHIFGHFSTSYKDMQFSCVFYREKRHLRQL